jgi:hypothetical protein
VRILATKGEKETIKKVLEEKKIEEEKVEVANPQPKKKWVFVPY